METSFTSTGDADAGFPNCETLPLLPLFTDKGDVDFVNVDGLTFSALADGADVAESEESSCLCECGTYAGGIAAGVCDADEDGARAGDGPSCCCMGGLGCVANLPLRVGVSGSAMALRLRAISSIITSAASAKISSPSLLAESCTAMMHLVMVQVLVRFYRLRFVVLIRVLVFVPLYRLRSVADVLKLSGSIKIRQTGAWPHVPIKGNASAHAPSICVDAHVLTSFFRPQA